VRLPEDKSQLLIVRGTSTSDALQKWNGSQRSDATSESNCLQRLCGEKIAYMKVSSPRIGKRKACRTRVVRSESHVRFGLSWLRHLSSKVQLQKQSITVVHEHSRVVQRCAYALPKYLGCVSFLGKGSGSIQTERSGRVKNEKKTQVRRQPLNDGSILPVRSEAKPSKEVATVKRKCNC